MKRALILAICAVVVILFYFFKAEITAFFTKVVKIYLSVSPAQIACTYLLVSDSMPKVESIIDITLLIWNCGSQNFTGQSKITLLDSLNRTIFSISSPTFFLEVNSLTSYTSSWYAFPAGKYLAVGEVFYDGKVERRYQPIEVTVPPPPPPPPPVVLPPVPVIAPPAILEMEINFTRVLNVTQATSYPILVVVNNTGTIPLKNLTLSLRSEEELIKIGPISPEVILELEPGYTGLFLSSIFIHPDTPEGRYRIFLNVSDSISRSGEIALDVKKLGIKENALNLLRYYRFLLDYVKGLANRIEVLEKRNITAAKEKFFAVERDYEVARRFYDLMFYERAVEKLDEVRHGLSEIIELLTIAPPLIVKPPRVPAIPVFFYILIPISIITIALIAFFIWRKIRAPVIRYKRW